MRINQTDNPDVFEEARFIGRYYYLRDFKIILWRDHISVIGNRFDKPYEYESVDLYISHVVWNHVTGKSQICNWPIELIKYFPSGVEYGK